MTVIKNKERSSIDIRIFFVLVLFRTFRLKDTLSLKCCLNVYLEHRNGTLKVVTMLELHDFRSMNFYLDFLIETIWKYSFLVYHHSIITGERKTDNKCDETLYVCSLSYDHLIWKRVSLLPPKCIVITYIKTIS